MLERLTRCPLCNHDQLIPFLESKDYFFTREPFVIDQCARCGFRFTNPRPEEVQVARYYQSEDYISHEATGNGWFVALYRVIRRSAIRGKYRLIRRFTTGDTLLDIGCGTGEFARYCQLKGMDVTGIEPAEKARQVAMETNNLNIFPDYLGKPTEKAHYHCITLWHVLEHVYQLDNVMEKIALEIDPEGMLVLALPNSEALDARYYKQFWAAYDLPRHVYHFTTESVTALADKFHWEIRGIFPMKWDAFYISLLSEHFKNSRFSYLRALLQGVRSTMAARRKGIGWSSQVYILTPKKHAIKRQD